MITSIELQVISKLLTSDDPSMTELLLQFDPSYYSTFRPHIEFILNHQQQYGNVPDVFTFQAEFPDINLVQVSESKDYIINEMRQNKQHILLLETFNKLKDLGSGDVSSAWDYLQRQCDRAHSLDNTQPMDLVKDAHVRAAEVVEFSKQKRIPTGFDEVDKLMYGGLSTVEELLVIIARTNTGKSWVCTKMMESAQSHKFNTLYYSPEMRAAFLGTRFDTWRNHFQNSQLFQGNYTEQYYEYLKSLTKEETSAYILEDKDVAEGAVTVSVLDRLVHRNNISLLIVDGLSYMVDEMRADSDYIRYKNICAGLFKLSKKHRCAVVVVMQANRETRETKDDKGDVFPTMYNAEGSDHPSRIATQVFSLRQVFDKHVLDIRLEKSRMANNQKPVLSYAWDPNTGSCRYLPDGENDPVSNMPTSTTPTVTTSPNIGIHHGAPDDIVLDDEDSEVEF